jgi:hypothetical protein
MAKKNECIKKIDNLIQKLVLPVDLDDKYMNVNNSYKRGNVTNKEYISFCIVSIIVPFKAYFQNELNNILNLSEKE